MKLDSFGKGGRKNVEAMFSMAKRLGGRALRVGPAERGSVALEAFDSPAAVREWLSSLIDH